MEVFEISIEQLIPYERNPRKNDGAINRMVASIKEFGFVTPLLVRYLEGKIEIVAVRVNKNETPGVRV